MKTIFSGILLIGLAGLLPACRTNTTDTRLAIPQTTIPIYQSWEQTPMPDDIITGIPGNNIGYAANFHQLDANTHHVPLPNEPHGIESTTTLLEEDVPVKVTHRDSIQTEAGQSRNNIFSFSLPDTLDLFPEYDLFLYTLDIPQPVGVAEAYRSTGPGSRLTVVLVFDIPADAAAGIYSLKVGLEIDGIDYGLLPCMIEVN